MGMSIIIWFLPSRRYIVESRRSAFLLDHYHHRGNIVVSRRYNHNHQPSTSSSIPMSSSSFEIHSSFLHIAKQYDGFILDQYGVLHNGQRPLDGVSECLSTLVESMGKKCVILSNTSSPSDTAMTKLKKIGLDPDYFLGAITSGEEASKFILHNYGTDGSAKKCIWWTWNDEKVSNDFLQKCGDIIPVDDVDDADFIIAHGAEVQRGRNTHNVESLLSLGSFLQSGTISEEMNFILTKCQKRNLPMICANPDFIVHMANGSTGHMPGKMIDHRNDSIDSMKKTGIKDERN